MKKVNVADAKAHLSAYLREVKAGETIVICERNVPVAEVRPVVADPISRKRVFGRYDGTVEIDDSVFAPMTDQEIDEWMDDSRSPLSVT